MLLFVINITAATTAATIYSLWAVKWSKRRAWGLATLNGAVALVASAIAIAYGHVLTSNDARFLGSGIRSLLPIVLLLPALTRFLEMRRDERREAVARTLEDQLRNARTNAREDEAS